MEEAPSFRPLLAVGAQYIREAAPKITDADMETAKEVLENFLDSKISYEEATETYKKLLGTILPLEKIYAVLKVDEKPLPPPEDNGNFANITFSFNNATRKKTHPWSEIEDQRLLHAIHKHGLDNWAAVSAFVGNARTRAQCSQRWFRGLDPRISKVLWTPEEDAKLIELVEKYGDRSWTKIASEIGNRSDAQCRYHYKQLNKDKEDEGSSKQNHSSPQLTAVSSVPNSAFRAQLRPLLPSQSLFTIEKFNTKKIPPIDSFSDVINALPGHLKFKLPPAPVFPSQIIMQPTSQ